MKSRNSQMRRSASAYAMPGGQGPVETGIESERAASDRKVNPTPLAAPGSASPAPTRLTHEQVAARAKAIWLASGCRPGRDEQNWHEAEAQLQAELMCE